jgi:hypothetical protein
LASIWKPYGPLYFRHRVGLIEKIALSLFVLRRAISLSSLLRELASKDTARQSVWTELIAVAWLLVLAVSVFYPFAISGRSAIVLMSYLVWGAINYPLCIIFIDRYKLWWKPQSYNRLLILLFVNYLQIVAGFAYLYLHTAKVVRSGCSNAITSAGDALYFSVVTITTLGFGDMTPFSSWAKFLVTAEVLTGLVFLVLVVATIVGLSTKR